MSRSLLLFYGEDATEIELKAWQMLQASKDMKHTLFITVTDRASWDFAHERLTNEGWRITGMGSGGLRFS